MKSIPTEKVIVSKQMEIPVYLLFLQTWNVPTKETHQETRAGHFLKRCEHWERTQTQETQQLLNSRQVNKDLLEDLIILSKKSQMIFWGTEWTQKDEVNRLVWRQNDKNPSTETQRRNMSQGFRSAARGLTRKPLGTPCWADLFLEHMLLCATTQLWIPWLLSACATTLRRK